jgi:purine-binding chemotaxis protein CheW
MTGHYVIGFAAGQRIAIDAMQIESVIDVGAMTPTPLAPPHVVGLGAVRSLVLTVIDVAAAAGGLCDDAAVRAAIVCIDGHHYALRMTRVDDVAVVERAAEPVDESIGAGWHAVCIGRLETAQGAALLIDPARIISAAGAQAMARLN